MESAALPQESALQGAGKQVKVLIVDDAQFLCEGLRRSLRAAGFDAYSANDSVAAMDLIRRCCPDVIVTDLMMPGVSGAELIAHLARTLPDLPCIVITGNATRERILQVSRFPNLRGILVKPVDQTKLIGMISSATGHA